jgi:hypothetical protein
MYWELLDCISGVLDLDEMNMCNIYNSGTVVPSASQEILSWSWCVSGMLAKQLMETVFMACTTIL